MTLQLVELEWRGMPPALYCPACGAPVYEEAQDPTPCPHVVFSYIDIVGDFDHLNERHTELAEQASRLAEERDTLAVDEFIQAMDSTKVLCFSLTTNGMACGPTSSTVYAAFDFCPHEP
jgi:hypothetical protein